MADLKLKLVLDVTYDTNGVSVQELRANLRQIVERAMGDGWVTGETEATVAGYNVAVLTEWFVKQSPGVGFDRFHLVPSTIMTGDGKKLVKFDAVEWFQVVEDEQIMELARSDWGGNPLADAVAEFAAENEEEVSAIFEYIQNAGVCGAGFEVQIDKTKAMEWLRDNRRELWTALGGE